MKKIIKAVILMVLIPVCYAGADDKQSIDPVKHNASMSLKGYLPLPAKYSYSFFKEGVTKETEKADLLNCIERQRQIINFAGLNAGDEDQKSYQGYHTTVWATIKCMENKGYINMLR